MNVETIRYYERIGLLAAPLRTSSGYRSYTAQDVARLRFIKRGRSCFSLDEIRTLVELADQPGHACSDVDRPVQTHRSKCASASPTCSGLRRNCSARRVAISRR